MTRLRGPSVSSFDSSRGGIDRPHCCRSKLPPNAPDVISQNTVDVYDPAQVLLWYRDERRRQFNLLVRRYKAQLLYGCQDPGCLTPTCASYRRRVTEGPYRRYTELSARTLACYLASLDNAEGGLCRNVPRIPSDLAANDQQRRSKRRNRAPSTQSTTPERSDSTPVAQNPSRDILSNDTLPNSNGVIQKPRGKPHRSPSPGLRLQKQPLDSSEHKSPGTHRLKDPKSFTQNLFDTLSLRMIEWLPLRRSPSTFDPDSSSYLQNGGDSPNTTSRAVRLDSDRDRPQQNRRRPFHESVGSNPHTPSSRNAGTHATAVELRLQNQQIKRLSLTEPDLRRQSPRSSLDEKSHPELKPARKLSVSTHTNSNTEDFVSMPSPPALKHRPQKHRGRAVDPNGTCLQEQRKKERRVSWEGAKILNDVQPSENRDPPPNPDSHPSVETPPHENRKLRSESPTQDISKIQSLTHLTGDIIDELRHMLIISEEEAQRWREELTYMESSGSFEDFEWRFVTFRQRLVFTFITQSVFYALGTSRQILCSFRETTAVNETKQPRSSSGLNLRQLEPSFRKLFTICPKDIVFHSLWGALEALFVPPKELSASGRPSRRLSSLSNATAPIIARRVPDTFGNQYVTDSSAADVATVALFALASALPQLDVPTWRAILRMRAAGAVATSAGMQKFSLPNTGLVIDATDVLEHELALRLVDRLVRALMARLAFHEISKARHGYSQDTSKQRKNNVLDIIVDTLSEHHDLMMADLDDDNRDMRSPGAPSIIAEWLRTVLLKGWDGNPEMSKSSSEGGAVQILSAMYKERNRLGLTAEDFHTPFLSERLEPLEMPVQWMARAPSNKTLHLLSYSFLFPPSALVIYFRALNYAAMSKYYEAAMTTTRHVTQTAFGAIEIQDDVGLLARMKTSMTTYLVLVVRRDNLLRDALNQLWRRERRELMRPLKVQMGMDEGEEGLDHGGVQQEFFRVLMAEALDPSYGMFTMDSRTQISWFQPGSLEPLYKFELLGLLMSLAVYNGLTLPINFPTAFYRKLLGQKVKHLEHIQDGWPELTKGLGDLLSWDEGDVGDIFMRTYEFSFEVFGSVETVDMQKIDKDAPWPHPAASPRPSIAGRSYRYSTPWSEVRRYTDQTDLSPPSSMAAETADSHGEIAKSVTSSVPLQSPTPPAEEAVLVTNANRNKFVKDYIFWLTDKSIGPQFEAFAQGFYTCLDRPALSIFTPEALKTVVEGIQEIDMAELEHHARYEGGFGPNHHVIRDFWSIARGFSADKKARLLEFVTASDRVPVNGIASIMFVIQKNGVGDARLPTSLTCFGRLLLPEYSSKSVLEEKLDKALENARGFGVA